MPALAIGLAVAGLIPFIVCGLWALRPGVDAINMLAALVDYGAVVLAFLGGVQWGVAFQEAAQPRVQRWRLALGALPPLLGWVALLAGLLLWDWIALALLAAGFIGTMVVEHQAARRGLGMGGTYLWVRWGLTVVVVAMLVTVLTLRLLGVSVLL